MYCKGRSGHQLRLSGDTTILSVASELIHRQGMLGTFPDAREIGTLSQWQTEPEGGRESRH